MHRNVIEDYIKEIFRVLVPGGHSFIHHSNFVGGQDFSFYNIGGRSNMDFILFREIVEKNGMTVILQEPVNMNDRIVDYITVFVKP
jgi:hypothetical protein